MLQRTGVNKKLIQEKGLKMPETWDDLLQPGDALLAEWAKSVTAVGK